MTFTCCHCGLLLRSPEDLVLDDLRDVRNLDKAGQMILHHLHEAHAEQYQRSLIFATNVQKFFCLSSLLPVQRDAPMFVSGMEKLRVGLGALFVPEPIEKPDEEKVS